MIKYSIMHVNDRAKENMDRNKSILKNFEYVDIEYFNGNTGNGWDILNDMKIPLNKWKPYDGRTFNPLPGEYGIWVSTIRFMQYMIDNNIDKLLVLEDDVYLFDDFVENFNKCINELPETFSLLSFYAFDEHNEVTEETDLGLEYIHRSWNQPSGMQATLYSLDGVKKILKVLKRKGIEYTNDCFIFEQSRLQVIEGYSIKKNGLVFLDHDYKNIKSLIDPDNLRMTQ